MNREQIKEKILLEKNANLVDVIEIAGSSYAKALLIKSENEINPSLTYKYYKVLENAIQDVTQEELNRVKSFFEIDLGDIIY